MQVALAALPLVLGIPIAALSAAASHPYLAISMLGGGWTASGFGMVLWFRNHQAAREKRTLALGRLMFVSDEFTQWWSAHGARATAGTREEHFKTVIRQLLSHMCQIVVHRVDTKTKAATFIVLDTEGGTQRFRLYARFNHEDPTIDALVAGLSTEHSLAAQAIRLRKLIPLRDCQDNPPTSGVDWECIHANEHFHGRACTPVQYPSHGSWVTVGAICFETEIPWLLQKEDQQVMDLIADKIAWLWRNYPH